MKTAFQHLLLSLTCLGLLARPSTAQTFTTLYCFTAQSPNPAVNTGYTNSDGAQPIGGLVLSGNTLYGTASSGGSGGNGTLFALNIDGGGFTNLHSFTRLSSNTNNDGASPHGSLILSGNTLFGAASGGGGHNAGTVFAVNTDGTKFTSLHSFSSKNGFVPFCSLILSSNILYGTTTAGGNYQGGTVFTVDTNGVTFTDLYNADVISLWGGLILSGNTLYGVGVSGGSYGKGAVFAVSSDGTAFTNLYSFTATSGSYPNYTNNDGAVSYASLVLSGNTLYGVASLGGGLGFGTLFAINTNGTGFSVLHTFTGGSGGANPVGSLIVSGATLYGTTMYGGTNGGGTVFAINTNGINFTTLHSFTSSSDGASLQGTLVLSGNTLYGTASGGGSSGNGTVFSLTLPKPELTLTLLGTNAILAWPTNATDFTLQTTTNLNPPVVWIPINGQNNITNPISGSEQFFRLSQ